ncbi:response regulator [Phenylobacterium sp.]|uniref:response regulator n=1 Tax=Phenylobacterium sp. TaxID=1871053 RepID=UPI002FC73809
MTVSAPHQPRILIVDDDPAIVAALCQTLRLQGYEAVGLTDVNAALDALQASPFEVLLADLTMPRMSGLELLREARRRDPAIVGVIMTGEGTIGTAVEAMKTGALDYVLKPFKVGDIVHVLARALTTRQLRLENRDLQDSVRERTAALETALRDLEAQTAERLKAEQALMQAQKMEAIGRLTGGVAHNFNNLLMAIDGALHLLDKKLDPDHAGRKYIDGARQATERGAKVTNQLLAFSRTQRFDLRPIDVCGALRNAAPIFAQALGPTISLKLDLPMDGAWAMTDPDQLELAVINLTINARDAMPDGGEVTLGVAREVATSDSPEIIAVWLRDSGLGMSDETLARALEPFYTTKERGKGTGLGLAQVYGFASQCGGEVGIESTLGAGATIRIRLPLAEPSATESPAIDKTELNGSPEGAAGVRLLVVDDDDAVRQVLVDGLRLQGFQVFEAADGPSGLVALAREAPDALVLDYAMPEMNGAEVARRARALRPGLPVVFCSGYADTLALEGVDDALIARKPITVPALARMVSGLLAPRPGPI